MVFGLDFLEEHFPISPVYRERLKEALALNGGFVFLLVVLAYASEQDSHPSTTTRKCKSQSCIFAKSFLYSLSPACNLLPLCMGRVTERKKLLSFADVADRTAPPSSDVQGYDQLNFEGLATEEKKEVTIENLAVTKLPQVKKMKDRFEWSCTVSYQRDLWHQEDYGELVLHALHN